MDEGLLGGLNANGSWEGWRKNGRGDGRADYEIEERKGMGLWEWRWRMGGCWVGVRYTREGD